MIPDYAPTTSDHWATGWRRRAKVLLPIAIGSVVTIAIAARVCGYFYVRWETARFERTIQALHVIGLTSQQVVAKIGPPIADSRKFGDYRRGDDFFLVYTDSRGNEYLIIFRYNVAAEARFEDGRLN